jgi:FixJ family two-component response regulator
MTAAPTVFIVDDDPAVREYLRRLLGSVGLPAETYESGEQFLTTHDHDRPGCAILDVRMPGISGLEVLTRLKSLDVGPPVILFSGYCDVVLAATALRTGAVHILEKPCGAHELLEAVREGLQRDEHARSARALRAAVRARLALLSPREREVLDWIVRGVANKVMASRLNVKEKTIEFHRANVMRKMRARSVAELVRMVMRLDPDFPDGWPAVR